MYSLAEASLLLANFVGFSASLPLLLSAPRRRCCCRRIVVVVGVSSSLVAFLCRCRRLLFVVVVSILLLLSAASRNSLKSVVYIRLTMHATTMELQHKAHNGPAAL